MARMGLKPGVGLPEWVKLEIRRRVVSGERVDAIAGSLGLVKRTIYRVIAQAGGVPDACPRAELGTERRLAVGASRHEIEPSSCCEQVGTEVGHEAAASDGGRAMGADRLPWVRWSTESHRHVQELCVDRRQWLTSFDFEDAVGACNLLPGPASTQLAIYCASRVRGRLDALLGASPSR